MRKQLVFMCIIAALFLNSCAAAGIITGGLTVGCVGYEEWVNKPTDHERCPALEEIDALIER